MERSTARTEVSSRAVPGGRGGTRHATWGGTRAAQEADGAASLQVGFTGRTGRGGAGGSREFRSGRRE